jgi:NAD(P)-dependent dehydrogenase (short-subunit alcohol dehydrogenase family)
LATIFQIDLFDARGALPRSLVQVADREKAIRFSSRTRAVTNRLHERHGLHQRIRALAALLSPAQRADPQVQQVLAGTDDTFLASRAAMREMIFMGSVHSKEASVLKAPYVTAKHSLEGLTKVIAKEGAAHGVRANLSCPGFVRTPLVDKQIPEQAQALGISEDDVIKKRMLKETVDGEFTTIDDVAQVALLFAGFPATP